MMNPRRFPTVAAPLCGTVVLGGCVVAWLAGFGSAGIENTGAVPIEDRRAPSLTADAELADAPQATAMGNAAVASDDVVTAAELVTGTATDTMAASDGRESIVEAALPDASQMLPPETPPVQVATASTPDPVPNDAKEAVTSIEILDECLVADICIDRYLWALYQRTPKEDTIKVHERRKVTVKKKGKTVTVTKSFTKLVDADFTWKDPKAAEKTGMPMMDYVIGGMDRSFKLRLFHTLRAAEEAGLSLIHMALAFVLRHPAVTAVIIGPRTQEHLASQLGAVDVQLSDDILDQIDAIVIPGTNFSWADAGYAPPGVADLHQRRR